MKKFAILFFAVVLLTGCTKEVVKETSLQDTSKEEKVIVTVTNYGRELSLTKVPEHVLTFGPNCTETFIALGLEHLVIGNSLDNHSRGALAEYKEKYDAIPELTYGNATREAVLTSGADFIYGIDWEFGQEAINIEELESFGITSYLNSATTFEEFFKEISDIGTIFQIEEKAAAFIANQKQRIDAVQTKIQNIERPKVLVYDAGGSGVFTASGTNFENLIIEAAGGENIFAHITDKQWVTVSYEDVIERNPEYIIIHDYDSPAVDVKITEIKAHPALSQLEAVKNEKFIIITLESVLPGNRLAYSVELIASQLYPNLF